MSHFTKKFLLLALLAVTLTVPTGMAAASDQPGYLDLDFIDIPQDADQIQDINLGPMLKEVVREARNNEDPEIAELLSMVHNLRLRSFSIDENSAEMASKAVAKVSSRLKKDDWDNLMKFKDGDQLTTVSTKYHNDHMVGLMIVVYEPESEVTFINLVGELDLGKLMRLATEVDSDELGDYLDQVGSGSGLHLE